MLQKHINRQPLTRRGWAAAVLTAAVVSLPLAAASLAEPEVIVLQAQQPAATPVTTSAPAPMPAVEHSPVPAPVAAPAPRPVPAPLQAGSINGQVTDQSGGVIPGARVTLTDRQTSTQTQAISNAMGMFTFPNLTPAEYQVMATLPGFKSVVNAVTVSSGAAAQLSITLPMGSLSETINVSCSPESFSMMRALFPVLSAQTPGTPIRVGGQIREPKKIKDVRPTCPASAASGEHVVLLTGTVGVDGAVSDVAPSEGAAVPPADLLAASLDAVRQWVFTPTRLNGQPVEVSIVVTIKFTKS